jgi:hypothetical protein
MEIDKVGSFSHAQSVKRGFMLLQLKYYEDAPHGLYCSRLLIWHAMYSHCPASRRAVPRHPHQPIDHIHVHLVEVVEAHRLQCWGGLEGGCNALRELQDLLEIFQVTQCC